MTPFADGESDHLDRVRASLLQAALPHVPFDGWSERALRLAERDSGVDPALARMALPNGAGDLVAFFWTDLDRRMTEALAQIPFEGRTIRERIALAIRTRLELLAPNKEAARRAVAFQALPINAASAAQSLWSSVDTMWRGVGDTTTDFAFYTKRASLGALWSVVLFTWFGDNNPDEVDTQSVLNRGLAGLMQFERGKARLRAFTRRLPSPIGLLRRLRYPELPSRGEPLPMPTGSRASAPAGAFGADSPADPWTLPRGGDDPWKLPRE